VKYSGSHIVPLTAIPGKSGQIVKDVAEKIEGRRRGMAVTEGFEALQPELLVVGVAGVGKAVGAEEQAIARLVLHGEFVVTDGGEEARRDTGDLQDLALLIAQEQGPGHTCAGNAYLGGLWAKHGIRQRGVPAGNAAEAQAVVEQGKHGSRTAAGRVHAAQGTNGQSRVEGRWQTFARNVADVKPDGAVGED